MIRITHTNESYPPYKRVICHTCELVIRGFKSGTPGRSKRQLVLQGLQKSSRSRKALSTWNCSNRTAQVGHICQKRPTYVKRDLHMSKETYICQKRPTYVKRDLRMSKETCICQKRPTYVKKTNICQNGPTNVKRDLHT